MTPRELEPDAVALELLLTLRVAREVIQRAMDDGLLPERLWVTSDRSLLACMDEAIEHGMYVLNPLPPPGGAPAAPRATGDADAWRAAFEDTMP